MFFFYFFNAPHKPWNCKNAILRSVQYNMQKYNMSTFCIKTAAFLPTSMAINPKSECILYYYFQELKELMCQ